MPTELLIHTPLQTLSRLDLRKLTESVVVTHSTAKGRGRKFSWISHWMASKAISCFFAALIALSCSVKIAEGQLSPTYYAQTCPNVESIAQTWFNLQVLNHITAPAALLRLAFHDCAVQGCDASIMLQSAPALGIVNELGASLNLGISDLDVIDGIKAAMERQCPGVVSCADIIALAGRDAVRLVGGPTVHISLGRKDGVTASAAVATRSLLPATATVTTVLNSFANMGISTIETVALFGSHTVGVGHCANIVNRLYPVQDAQLPFLFAFTLKLQCGQNFSTSTTVSLDSTTLLFDNQYYRDVQNRRGLLSIDAALGTDPRTQGIMQQFAQNQQLFFSTFSSAYTKLTEFKVLTGAQGEIRKNCRFRN